MERPQGAQAFEWFRQRLEQDAALLGVCKEKNVEHHIHLLMDAVNRAIFNIQNNVVDKPQSIEEKARKFIAVFNLKFDKATGGAVRINVTPEQKKIIEHTIKTLEKGDGDIEEYINYVFDEFLPKNPKMLPGLGTLLIGFVQQSYFIEYRERIQKRKQIILNDLEAQDIIGRYRAIMRNKEIPVSLQQSLQLKHVDYHDGNATLKQFKEEIIRVEEAATLLAAKAQSNGPS